MSAALSAAPEQRSFSPENSVYKRLFSTQNVAGPESRAASVPPTILQVPPTAFPTVLPTTTPLTSTELSKAGVHPTTSPGATGQQSGINGGTSVQYPYPLLSVRAATSTSLSARAPGSVRVTVQPAVTTSSHALYNQAGSSSTAPVFLPPDSARSSQGERLAGSMASSPLGASMPIVSARTMSANSTGSTGAVANSGGMGNVRNQLYATGFGGAIGMSGSGSRRATIGAPSRSAMQLGQLASAASSLVPQMSPGWMSAVSSVPQYTAPSPGVVVVQQQQQSKSNILQCPADPLASSRSHASYAPSDQKEVAQRTGTPGTVRILQYTTSSATPVSPLPPPGVVRIVQGTTATSGMNLSPTSAVVSRVPLRPTASQQHVGARKEDSVEEYSGSLNENRMPPQVVIVQQQQQAPTVQVENAAGGLTPSQSSVGTVPVRRVVTATTTRPSGDALSSSQNHGQHLQNYVATTSSFSSSSAAPVTLHRRCMTIRPVTEQEGDAEDPDFVPGFSAQQPGTRKSVCFGQNEVRGILSVKSGASAEESMSASVSFGYGGGVAPLGGVTGNNSAGEHQGTWSLTEGSIGSRSANSGAAAFRGGTTPDALSTSNSRPGSALRRTLDETNPRNAARSSPRESRKAALPLFAGRFGKTASKDGASPLDRSSMLDKSTLSSDGGSGSASARMTRKQPLPKFRRKTMSAFRPGERTKESKSAKSSEERDELAKKIAEQAVEQLEVIEENRASVEVSGGGSDGRDGNRHDSTSAKPTVAKETEQRTPTLKQPDVAVVTTSSKTTRSPTMKPENVHFPQPDILKVDNIPSDNQFAYLFEQSTSKDKDKGKSAAGPSGVSATPPVILSPKKRSARSTPKSQPLSRSTLKEMARQQMDEVVAASALEKARDTEVVPMMPPVQESETGVVADQVEHQEDDMSCTHLPLVAAEDRGETLSSARGVDGADIVSEQYTPLKPAVYAEEEPLRPRRVKEDAPKPVEQRLKKPADNDRILGESLNLDKLLRSVRPGMRGETPRLRSNSGSVQNSPSSSRATLGLLQQFEAHRRLRGGNSKDSSTLGDNTTTPRGDLGGAPNVNGVSLYKQPARRLPTITRDLLHEMRGYTKPNMTAQRVCAVFATTVLEKPEFLQHGTTWLQIRRCFSNVGDVCAKAQTKHALEPDLLKKIRCFLRKHNLNSVQALQELPPAMIRVLDYVRAFADDWTGLVLPKDVHPAEVTTELGDPRLLGDQTFDRILAGVILQRKKQELIALSRDASRNGSRSVSQNNSRVVSPQEDNQLSHQLSGVSSTVGVNQSAVAPRTGSKVLADGCPEGIVDRDSSKTSSAENSLRQRAELLLQNGLTASASSSVSESSSLRNERIINTASGKGQIFLGEGTTILPPNSRSATLDEWSWSATSRNNPASEGSGVAEKPIYLTASSQDTHLPSDSKGSLTSEGQQVSSSSSSGHSTQLGASSASEVESESRAPLEVLPDVFAKNYIGDRSAVRDLVIAKPGVGSVLFEGATDMSRIPDMDALHARIQLLPGEIVVYPEHPSGATGTSEIVAKPPVGEELNKPAYVTLLNCRPPGSGDVTEKVAQKYRDKVQKMTEVKGAQFISYDARKGIWVFRVAHF
ncbi:unnamed protein product [Amoebophrya sp. A25]|nr:unnamed protein product [Amoebophrya sp. A25]|eukprot:GSA25T00014403001.1